MSTYTYKEEYYKIEELAMEEDILSLTVLAKEYQRLADIANSYVKAINSAPVHNGEKCLTHVQYGHCPPWPHG